MNKYDIVANHVYMCKENIKTESGISMFKTGTCYMVDRFIETLPSKDVYVLSYPVKFKGFSYSQSGMEHLISVSDFQRWFCVIPELDLTNELYEAMRNKGYETISLVYPKNRNDNIINDVGIFPRT